ncbi:DUF882 domain-containing protein [Arvimicrobium flavum]|uniref:DUF882 domain-containing protein n=1 Tax=Arvimicrobium flavum TaxID=3393320 RepID=UPI00237C28C0|nr:DUF882 domain-containing protein [Mesorhizobium shangrilense]
MATQASQAETRSLKLHFIHTGEKAEIVYKRNGRYDSAGLAKINRFLRDWRRNEPTKMNPRLLDLVWSVYEGSGSNGYINVVSAYRSPATNSMLRSRSKGVAKKSQHMLGNAMDFFIPGVPLKKVRDLALKAQGGGVGYYPRSGSPFIHMDVGNVRHWPRMSRKELVAVFPKGNTLHVPSDGKPLPGFDQALASYESRKKSGGTALAMVGNDSGRKSKGLLAALFGRSADEEEESGGVADAEETPARREPQKPAEVARPTPMPAIEPRAPVPAEEVPETIVAALPQRSVPLPEIAPRPSAEVGPAPAAELPIDMNDPVVAAIGAAPADSLNATVAEASFKVPLPTWRPDYAPANPEADDPILLALANADAGVPMPTQRPAVAEAIEAFAAVPEARPEPAVMAVADQTGMGMDDEEEEEDSFQIAALIEASAPRDLAAERALENEPVTIVRTETKSTQKAGRATPRDSKPRPASVVVPAQPADARWALDTDYVAKGKGGNSAPSFAYNIVRTAPIEVYADGFQPGGKELDTGSFSGKAVAFLPVARFETN